MRLESFETNRFWLKTTAELGTVALGKQLPSHGICYLACVFFLLLSSPPHPLCLHGGFEIATLHLDSICVDTLSQ